MPNAAAGGGTDTAPCSGLALAAIVVWIAGLAAVELCMLMPILGVPAMVLGLGARSGGVTGGWLTSATATAVIGGLAAGVFVAFIVGSSSR